MKQENIAKRWECESGPYEKFIKYGAKALTEAELLAIIIRTGTRDYSAVELGEQILSMVGKNNGGLNSLYHISLKELMGIKGIGLVKAVRIQCITEFSIRMAKETAKEHLKFNNPATIAEYYKEELRHSDKEAVLLLLLDNKLQLIEEYFVSLGTGRASLLSPREIFIRAFKVQASNLILIHNHPNGIPKPSSHDISITKKVKEIGETIDVPLIDHIIIGDNKYMSFKESELL